jgi:hypothetical protein
MLKNINNYNPILNTKNNKNLLLLVITILSLCGAVLVNTAYDSKAQDFPLNQQECDQVIKNTYYNLKARNSATIYNAQKCLSIAGYFDHGGKFTTYYGPITENAAIAYINGVNNSNESANKEEAAKAEALRIKIQQEELQKKAEEARVETLKQDETRQTQEAQTKQVAQQNNSSEQKIDTTGETGPVANNTKIEVAKTTPLNNSTNSREPISLDRILVSSIYFLFALPFILFGLSIIAAFLKVFKKRV